tara:strand:- start:1726 stop:2667 length:942 start_codon:yes stop_codon:yes gene_type:complete
MHLFHGFFFYAILLSIVGLSGCGGSSSKATDSITAPPISSVTPTVLQGIFVDSAVAGLAYTTDTQSGKTNAQGQFLYIEGEEVVFSIGDIKFPTVVGQEMISPLDVFSVTTTDDVRVSNMARLLQTLDEDGIAGNGISITDEAHNQATAVTVDFGADNFEQQVVDVVANAGAAYTTLISSQSAIEHLNLSLANNLSLRKCAADSTKIGYTGTFSTLAHNVSGTATVINNCTIEISMFNFDGAAPNVKFYAGVNGNFSDAEAFGIGERIDGRTYSNETIILTLPEGKFVDDFDSLSVWCVEFQANFGDLRLLAP